MSLVIIPPIALPFPIATDLTFAVAGLLPLPLAAPQRTFPQLRRDVRLRPDRVSVVVLANVLRACGISPRVRQTALAAFAFFLCAVAGYSSEPNVRGLPFSRVYSLE